MIKKNFRLNGIDILIFCLGLESSAPSDTHVVLNEKKIHLLYARKLCQGLFIFKTCLQFSEYSPLKYRVYRILLISINIKAP